MRIFTIAAATFVGTGLVVAVPTAAEAKSFSVTVSAPAQAEVGHAFTIRGTVSPSAKGKKVTVQRRLAGQSTYRTVARPTVRASGKYAASITPTKAGKASYRVVKAAQGSRKTGRSATRTVTSFRWRSLNDIATRSTVGGPVFEGAVAINGNTFARSVSIRGDQSIEYDLTGLSCNRFRAYVGISDESVGGTQAQSTAYDPDSTLFTARFLYLAQGLDPVYADRPINGGPLLRLVVSPDGDPADVFVAYGSPKVYCAS